MCNNCPGKSNYLGLQDDIFFLIYLFKIRRLAHREISYPFKSCNCYITLTRKMTTAYTFVETSGHAAIIRLMKRLTRLWLMRTTITWTILQQNAQSEASTSSSTLASAAHSFKRTWRCQAICFEFFFCKLTSVFFASTAFLVQFCYKALFRH